MVLPAAESAPDAFTGEQTGLNASFQEGLKIPQHEVFHALDLERRAGLKAWPSSKFRSVILSKNATV